MESAQEKNDQGWRQKAIRPERAMAAGFLALIVVGGLLLSLPISTVNRQSIGLFNGLFTATSAVCVTGLVVVDTGPTFSIFGQCVLMALIQTGGLGFMIFATLVMLALGRRVTIQPGEKKGEVTLEYYGPDDLERLTRALMEVKV